MQSWIVYALLKILLYNNVERSTNKNKNDVKFVLNFLD